MRGHSPWRGEGGQAAVEYVGLVLLVALLFGAVLASSGFGAALVRLPKLLSERLVCAVKLSSACHDELERAYGSELTELLREHLPEVRFEDDEFVSLPVDPRRCRERRCADTSRRGAIRASHEGERPTLFAHPIDCRGDPFPEAADCAGERSGHVYLQYWLYFPDSATKPFGQSGYHLDDWESLQIRIGGDGAAEARASSHKGHQYGPDPLSDAGVELPLLGSGPGWGPSRGYLWVSAGSHAGRASGGDFFRMVLPEDLRLIPVEPNLDQVDGLEFAVAPPWRKSVWVDPEARGT